MLQTIGVTPTPNPHISMIMIILHVRWNPMRYTDFVDQCN